MARIALCVLTGLLMAGTISATAPWTASIFALALLVLVAGGKDSV